MKISRALIVLSAAGVSLGGCATTVPVAYRTEYIPVVRQHVNCQNAEWDDIRGAWICRTPYSATVIASETVVIDNVMYGIVGGMIAGYWLGNAWHHGVPYGFRHHHRYRVAPHGYVVVPRHHSPPRGFYRPR